MLGLDGGNSSSKSKRYYINYKLLDKRHYILRASGNFFKINNWLRKLVCISKLKTGIKTRKNDFQNSHSSFKNIKRWKIFWLSNSDMINKFLKKQINI